MIEINKSRRRRYVLPAVERPRTKHVQISNPLVGLNPITPFGEHSNFKRGRPLDTSLKVKSSLLPSVRWRRRISFSEVQPNCRGLFCFNPYAADLGRLVTVELSVGVVILRKAGVADSVCLPWILCEVCTEDVQRLARRLVRSIFA